MGSALRVGLFALLALAALGAGLYAIVSPPAPLALPAQGAVLDGVTLVRPGEGREAHRRVVISGGAIERIEEAGPGGGGPFAGMYVLPGLNDLHVHFPPASPLGQSELFAFLLLYHGVTGARDAGDVDGTATEPVRRGVAEGRFPGPRVEACGMFVDAGPRSGRTRCPGVVRDGRLYGREALDLQLARYRAHLDGEAYDALVTPIVRRMLAGTRG